MERRCCPWEAKGPVWSRCAGIISCWVNAISDGWFAAALLARQLVLLEG
jgi:hypothetical protein